MSERILNKKTLYIAGPMSGLPAYNAPAFSAAAADLRQRGYRVINPVELDMDAGFDPSTDSPEDFDLPAAVKRDVEAITECDAIVMLPGHETSKGATAERHVAAWLGKEVLSYPSMVPLAEAETAIERVVSIDGQPIRRDSNMSETVIGPIPPVKIDNGETPVERIITWDDSWGVREQKPVDHEWLLSGAKAEQDDGGFHPIGREKLTEAATGSPDGKLWLPETDEHSVGQEVVQRLERFTNTLKDGDTVTNERGGKQSHLSARFDCIPPEVLRLLAQCLGFGASKYGKDNWRNIDQEDNLAHAMNHINEYRLGDRSEPHLVNTMARVTFALWQAIEKGDQPTTYIHPDMVASK